MNKIGDNIRLLRRRIGLTQIGFSKQIGISQGTLSDIEQGQRCCTWLLSHRLSPAKSSSQTEAI